MSHYSDYLELQKLQNDIKRIQKSLKRIQTDYRKMLDNFNGQIINKVHNGSGYVVIRLLNTTPNYESLDARYETFILDLKKIVSLFYKEYLLQKYNFLYNFLFLNSHSKYTRTINKNSKKLKKYFSYEITIYDEELYYSEYTDNTVDIFYDKYIVEEFKKNYTLLLNLQHDVKNKMYSIEQQIEDEFRSNNFYAPNFELLFKSDAKLQAIIKNRYINMTKNITHEAHLSAIIMMGSILEGLLFHILSKNPKDANTSKSTPKKEGKPKPFKEWSLQEMISVADDLGWIQRTTSKFSFILREYRNFIHPREQLSQNISNQEISDTYQLNLKALELVIQKLEELLEDDLIQS